MDNDLNMAVMRSTYKLEQPKEDGTRLVGTAWLVNLGDDKKPKIAMITAHHVLLRMEKEDAVMNWRVMGEDGKWIRRRDNIKIRSPEGHPLWLHHPEQDIAVMWVQPPGNIETYVLPFDALADEKTIVDLGISMGDEMLALGYPRGLSANDLGFPILRSGRVASYPITPIKSFTSFLMDFSVFSGNSGGPVYISEEVLNRGKRKIHNKIFGKTPFVAGLIVQQVNLDKERLEIGIVIHSAFIIDILKELKSDDHDEDDNIA